MPLHSHFLSQILQAALETSGLVKTSSLVNQFLEGCFDSNFDDIQLAVSSVNFALSDTLRVSIEHGSVLSHFPFRTFYFL